MESHHYGSSPTTRPSPLQTYLCIFVLFLTAHLTISSSSSSAVFAVGIGITTSPQSSCRKEETDEGIKHLRIQKNSDRIVLSIPDTESSSLELYVTDNQVV
jgi:hypothetical protein